MRSRWTVALLACLALVLVAPAPAGKKGKKEKRQEPELVTVQHVLISFGRKSGKKVERTKKEAEELAYQILERAQNGEEFDALVKEYTNDSYPGIYTMTNRGAARRANSYPRQDMAASFGDVAFSLEVGEVGIAKYSAGMSPFGWHIIQRLE